MSISWEEEGEMEDEEEMGIKSTRGSFNYKVN